MRFYAKIEKILHRERDFETNIFGHCTDSQIHEFIQKSDRKCRDKELTEERQRSN